MCEFGYFVYERCHHRFIEITNHCSAVLWKAGLTGKLIPCKETIYTNIFYNSTTVWTHETRPRGDKKPKWWRGKSGFCRKCEDEFKVITPLAFSERSHPINCPPQLSLAGDPTPAESFIGIEGLTSQSDAQNNPQ
jgi:hypothetical protein